MKTTKLVVGILMIVLAFIIAVQSAIVIVGNAMDNQDAFSGAIGILVALIYLVAGIVYIVTKKASKLTADIINAIILSLGWVFANIGADDYTDLYIWGFLGVIIGLSFLTWHYLKLRKAEK